MHLLTKEMVGLVVFILLCAMSSGFNLAPKHAQMYNVPATQGSSNYFGYTVALQRRTAPDRSWLIVGAPKANSTHRNHLTIVEPGVVYQCDLTSSSNECTPILLDPEGNSEHTLMVNSIDRKNVQLKDHAWVGGALDIQDKKDGAILVCGPRWKNEHWASEADNDWDLNGICYWKQIDFTSPSSKAKQLVALNNIDNRVLLRENKTIPSFYHKYGEAGISAHFIKDSSELLIGAPGVFNWRGTVVRYQNKDSEPEVPNPIKIKKLGGFEYFGYSVDAGIFQKSSVKTYYVSGAPRANLLNGSVFVFDFPASNGDDYRMLIQLNGTQFGEYFGASVCVVDVNADGLDDLLVGAPQFSFDNLRDRERLRKRSDTAQPDTKSDDDSYGDEGRVYVYINDGSLTFFNKMKADKMLTGSKAFNARFGTTITSIGDANLDGFNDIAIGAPYEDDGKGAIYIYHGRKSGINPKYSQRISATEIHHAISGFGISISRGMDIDGNLYNDLAVGAYDSGHAILIKSYPGIVFKSKITTTVDKLSKDATNFAATFCLTFVGKREPANINALVEITIDPTLKLGQRRAHFVKGNTAGYTATYNVSLSLNTELCSTLDIEILIDRAKLLYTKPIELLMKYNLDTSGYDDETFCPKCAVVDPSNERYNSKLVYYEIGCDSKICHPDLQITAEILGSVTLPITHGSHSTLSMRAFVRNIQETAFLMRLIVTLPAVTSLVRMPSPCRKITPSREENSAAVIELDCRWSDYFSNGSVVELDLEVSLQSVEPGTEQLVFSFNVSSDSSDSVEMTPNDNVQVITVPIKTIADIGISGSSNQYSERINTLINQNFSHTYEVRNYGPSPINKLSIDFQIPVSLVTWNDTVKFVSVFKPSAHLDGQPFQCTTSGFNFTSKATDVVDKQKEEDIDSSAEEAQPTISRIKRSESDNVELDFVSRELLEKQFSVETTLFINCSNLNVMCMNVHCKTGPFPFPYNRAIISFTIVADLTKIRREMEGIQAIFISSKGTVSFVDLTNVTQEQNMRSDESTTVTLFYGPVTPPPTFTYWMLAVAIALGILLLIIIIAILTRVGFFERQKKEDLQKLKEQVTPAEEEALFG